MKIIVFGLVLVSLVNVSFAMSPVEFGKSVGANENLVNELRDACQSANDPTHCFGVGLSISNAESNMCKAKTSHGCFGLVGAKDKSAYRWVKSYNKYRYKATNGFFFYGDRGTLSKSRYCTSEDSSGSKVGCPAGRKNFDSIYNQYNTEVVNHRIFNPPLDSNIKTHKPECYFIGYLDEGDYLQLDSILGRLIQIIRPQNREKQKIFKCSSGN